LLALSLNPEDLVAQVEDVVLVGVRAAATPLAAYESASTRPANRATKSGT